MKLFRQVQLAAAVGIFLGGLAPAQAVGVLVKPDRIDLTARPFQSQSVILLVSNPALEPAYYQISADDWSGRVRFNPSEFQLEAKGSQLVSATIKAPWHGSIRTQLSVVARPLGSAGLAAASGVKVPLTVSCPRGFWPAAVLIGLVVCLAAAFGVKLLSRRQSGRSNLLG